MLDIFKSNSNSSSDSELYKNIFRTSSEAVVIIDANDAIVDTNHAFENLFHNKDLSSENKIFKLKGDIECGFGELIDRYKQRSDDLSNYVIEASITTGERSTPLKIKFFSIQSGKKNQEIVYIVFKNIGHKQQLENLDTHNFISGFPNYKRAKWDIGNNIHRGSKRFALILLSVDQFDALRVRLGYEKLGAFIKGLANFLSQSAEERRGMLYHLAVNDFLLFVPNITSKDEIEIVVGRLKSDMEKFFQTSQGYENLTFSIGATLYPGGARGEQLLLDLTYKAHYDATKKGEGLLVINSNSIDSDVAKDEVALIQEMKEALKEGEFQIYYQPLIEVNTGKIFGAEALIRWKHPTKGFIAPSLFIPLANKTGFIVELGKFIITQAMRQQKQWELFNFGKIEISINITLREIENGGLVSFIENELEKYSIKPNLIRFDIPENIAMVNSGIAKKEFDALKKLGVSLSLDNFGSGKSSITILRSLPLDTLKIDSSFILDILTNSEHQVVVKAMIALAHTFGLKVVASGVENKEIFNMLKLYGCDIVQGFYLAKPLQVFEFQELIGNDVNLLTLIEEASQDKKEETISVNDYYDLYQKRL